MLQFLPEQLTTAVVVIDRLISLLKTRGEDQQHLVNDIVVPYFDELQVAYTAYLATLRTTKEMVERGESFATVYKKVEPLRAADLIVRDKVREMAEAYNGALSTHSDIAEFFDEAISLFGYWNGYHNSGTLRILTALEEGSGVYSHKFLAESIKMTISSGEEQWRRLASRYANIRAKYLQPAKLAFRHNAAVPNPKPRRVTRFLKSIRAFLS